jgi:hypothetical protein
LTFAVPARVRVKQIELDPELLSRPGTVTAVEPDHARWLP